MSQSNVGTSGIYEAGDQRNRKNDDPANQADRFHEGKTHSHKAQDSKDERSLANKLAREQKRENEPTPEKDFETMQSKKDSTLPAISHGNEPSKGAKIDQELAEEENETLKKKGRPGPYINAEVSGGGFPGWLQRVPGQLRTNSSEFLDATSLYSRRVAKVIAQGQITNGGPVILFQPENEYTEAKPGILFPDKEYMQAVEDKFRAAGIVVPFLSNDKGPDGNFASGTGRGAVDIYGHDAYPLGFDCAQPYTWPQGALPTEWGRLHLNQSFTTPYSLIEFQGGSFDPWGGLGFAQCADLLNYEFERVFYKNDFSFHVTIFNIYMTYGGTNWGNLGHPGGYTSYDYGAVINEDRQVTREKYSEAKLEASFLQASPAYLSAVAEDNTFANGSYTTSDALAVTRVSGERTGFFVLRHALYGTRNSTNYKLQVPTSAGNLTLPQLQGELSLHGRDSKIHVTDYEVGNFNILYSTAEIFTWKVSNSRTVLVIYGGPGERHELAVAGSTPANVIEGGYVQTKTGKDSTILNWHTTPQRRIVRLGSLFVYVLDRNSGYDYWTLNSSGEKKEYSHPSDLIVRAGYLMRTARIEGNEIKLTGDLNCSKPLEIISGAPLKLASLRFNGKPLQFTQDHNTVVSSSLEYQKPNFDLPNLTQLEWKYIDSLPEISNSYDDSLWTKANLTETPNISQNLRTPTSLYSSDYGYHTGNLLYRGHFVAAGNETSLFMETQGGFAFGFSAWLNDTFIGSWRGIDADENYNSTFQLPQLVSGRPYVFTVLLDNTGLAENGEGGDGDMKQPRGILRYQLNGRSQSAVTWKLTGNLGGENYQDLARGPLNEGGLYAERQGYHLPKAPVSQWTPAKPTDGLKKPGVRFYYAHMDLDLPSGYDVPLSFDFANSTASVGPVPNYRAQLYVNGYQFGKYGPQDSFPVPEGILNHRGRNYIGLSLWALDRDGAKLDGLELKATGMVQTGYESKQAHFSQRSTATYHSLTVGFIAAAVLIVMASFKSKGKRKAETIDLTGSFEDTPNGSNGRKAQRPDPSASSHNGMDQSTRDSWADAASEVATSQEFDDNMYQSYQLYGILHTKAVGCRYYSGFATKGEFVLIRREPSNPYDSNAIRIDNCDRKQIGHIPRGMAAKLARFLDSQSLIAEGRLSDVIGAFDAPIELKLYGTSEPVEAAALKQEMKDARLPISELVQAEREQKRRQKEEQERRKRQHKQMLNEAASRAMSVREDGNKEQFEPGSQGFKNLSIPEGTNPPDQGPNMEEIMGKAVQFDPRELGQVVERFGAGEEKLAALPLAEQPSDLITNLLPYQRQALAWMLDRESPRLPGVGQDTTQLWKANNSGTFTNIATNFTQRSPELASGGILADDMGLGKTLEVISLLVADPHRSSIKAPTLIVAPLSVMSNWSYQAEIHVHPDKALKVLTYHEANKHANQAASALSQYDIVVTTYQTLAREYMPAGTTGNAKSVPRGSGLYSLKWRRVVVDEGHNIRNPKAKMAQAAYALMSHSRWILTGTPIVNNLKDLYSHIKFIRLTGGLAQLDVFSGALIRPLNQGKSEAKTLLQALISTVCLRRMKDMSFVDLRLPPVTSHRIPIDFVPHEREKYDAFQQEAQGLLAEYQHNKAKQQNGKESAYRNLLEVLLRLRQVCNHWKMCGERTANLMALIEQNKKIQLTPDNIKSLQELLQLSIDSQEECPVCYEQLHNPIITACGHTFGNECIERVIETQKKCPLCRAELNDTNELVHPPVEESAPPASDIPETSSSKVETLLDILRASQNKNDGTKTIVFSQWTSFLDIVQARLQGNNINYCRLDGTMKAASRDESLNALSNDPECTVMLASLSVCSVGLNLVAANQVILSDTWWAPAIEDQAIDRVHRLGQTRPTTVFRLVMRESIEERVLDVQQEKRKLMMVAFQDKTMKRGNEKSSRMADIQKLLVAGGGGGGGR
ncbi:MAG: hypothetical protein M1831_003537 [Alyxoria varia]|nr:MAG: hypothetical protein M1831_003537 [Alyxoria varia]